MNVTTIYEAYMVALNNGDRRKALSVVQEALGTGVDIRDIYLDVLQPAMYEVGRLWEVNQFTVAQEHLATAITQSVMAQIYPNVFARTPRGLTMVATCIGGELHELGMRTVADFFELDGWDVFYLGVNVPTADVVRMVDDRRADLLAISVTLGSHVVQARELIAAVRAAPNAGRVKIMVGGQPFGRSPTVAQSIGADFTARDAREAVRMANEVVQ